jgi:hypothetical protein
MRPLVARDWQDNQFSTEVFMIRIGAASIDITPELGRDIQGASVNKKAASVRDPLEANALFLESDEATILLISCDLVGLPTDFFAAVSRKIAGLTGVPASNVIIACTHTHTGPSLIETNYFKKVDAEYLDSLSGKLVGVAERTRDSLQPALLGWGHGVARIGYNRRVCWRDGRHEMHGDALSPDCTGLEGPDDPSHYALFAKKPDSPEILAVLHSNTSHPTCFYGKDFWSADFPGVSRAQIRAILGPVPVLFFNGCQGDISIGCQVSENRAADQSERACARAAHIVTGETLRLLHETGWHDDPRIAVASDELRVDVRLPSPERLDWAQKLLARVDAGETEKSWDIMFAHGITRLQREFGAHPTDMLNLRAIRIGETAIVTQPCELYCQFGLDIRRRSPLPHTMTWGLACGYNGYCPTLYASMVGGYSGEPFHWCRLEERAGYKLVDSASALLRQL